MIYQRQFIALQNQARQIMIQQGTCTTPGRGCFTNIIQYQGMFFD